MLSYRNNTILIWILSHAVVAISKYEYQPRYRPGFCLFS
jgi:hypothetical protein